MEDRMFVMGIVAQLVEWLLLTPDVHGSNPFNGNILYTDTYT